MHRDRATSREEIEKNGIVLPEGMSKEMLRVAIEIIEDWEADSTNMATYLAIDLFKLYAAAPD